MSEDKHQGNGQNKYANYNMGNANTQNPNQQNYAQIPMPNQQPNYPMQPQYGQQQGFQQPNYPSQQQGFQQSNYQIQQPQYGQQPPSYAPSNGKPFNSAAFWDTVSAPRSKNKFEWNFRVDKNNKPFGMATIRLPEDITAATYWVTSQRGDFPALVVDFGEFNRETNIFTIEKKVSLSVGGKNMARAVKNRDGQIITMTKYGEGANLKIVVEVHEADQIVDLTQ